MRVTETNCSLVAFALAGIFVATASSAQEFADARIETQRLPGNLHVLFGLGEGVIAGNIAALVGEDGVFVVDDQFPEIAPKYKEAIRELGGGDIDFVVNTHWHFDHADGNKVLGPEGVTIVSQTNSRDRMKVDNVINLVNQTRDQPAYPEDALPVITFEDRMSFHFNGQQIDLMHIGPAHTTGDTAVFLRGSNVVHMGDVFNNSGYPFIDADNGGSLAGLVAFCRAVLAELDQTAIVIPGHGSVADYRTLLAYTDMLEEILDRMAALVASGATLEQVVAARVTDEWDDAQGDPSSFVNRAYTSLTR
jgi:cyclase